MTASVIDQKSQNRATPIVAWYYFYRIGLTVCRLDQFYLFCSLQDRTAPQKGHANNNVSNVAIAQTIKFRIFRLHKQKSFVCLVCTNNKVLNVSIAQTIKF